MQSKSHPAEARMTISQCRAVTGSRVASDPGTGAAWRMGALDCTYRKGGAEPLQSGVLSAHVCVLADSTDAMTLPDAMPPSRGDVEPGRTRLAAALDSLLRLHDTPARTAAAFSVGVFFSFSPFIGFQILLSLAVAVLFRLNRLAVFVGLNTNLPWFLVPWYGGTTLIVATMLGSSSPAELRSEVESLFATGVRPGTFFDRAIELLSTAFIPLMVGATSGAALLACVTYPIVRLVLTRRAARTNRPAL